LRLETFLRFKLAFLSDTLNLYNNFFEKITMSYSSNLYESNKIKFEGVREDLVNFYSGYVNIDKIILLLEIWLYGFRAIIDLYGFEKAREFCLDDKTHSPIEFSWLEEYGVDIRSTKKVNFPFFRIISLFKKSYILPGSKVFSVFEKINSRLSKFAILSISLRIELKRKDALIDILKKLLSDYDQDDISEYLSAGLPKFFYADQVNLGALSWNDQSLECSPNAIMEFNGNENIFLYDKYVTLIGRQHGGGYGTYIGEHSVDYEEELSDQFIGWGLSKFNKRQHRFLNRNFSSLHSKKRRFVWVERGGFTKMYSYYFPFLYKTGIDLSSILCVYGGFVDSGIQYYSLSYTGLGNPTTYDDYRGIDLKKGFDIHGESLIKANDILIFDTFTATLMFYCLENKNTFLCITSKNDYQSFSKKNKIWFNILYKFGFAFYSDEQINLSNRLKEIYDHNLSFPEEVVNYHLKNFINI